MGFFHPCLTDKGSWLHQKNNKNKKNMKKKQNEINKNKKLTANVIKNTQRSVTTRAVPNIRFDTK